MVDSIRALAPAYLPLYGMSFFCSNSVFSHITGISYTNLQLESIFFLATDSIYWVTRTLLLNLLKSNVATRGWLTVFATDIEAQGVIGQPSAPLIVA